MKPWTILHTEWSQGWGGQEIRVVEECLGMAERGHRVLLACQPRADILPRARQMGIETRIIPMWANWDLLAAWRIAQLVRRERVDFLHTHSSVDSWLGCWVRLRSPVHLVRTRHLGRINTRFWNLVYRVPEAVITVGQHMSRALVEDFGLPASKVITIPTGVNPRRFRPDPPDPSLAAELGLEPGQPVVAIVAVLRRFKRHDLFCQMAAELLKSHPQTRFLIIGDGPGWQRVNGYLDQMNLRQSTIMTGHREDVERLLPLVTVLVLTSEDLEGASQSISQAMSCQRAVVANDRGSISDLVLHQKTGLLVPFGDPKAMAEAVGSLLDDDALRRRLAAAGREHVLARYTREHMLDGTEEVYRRIMSNGRGG